MKFEYDPAKSAINKMKHGLDTYRGEAVRIISVRRSRKEEVEHYES